MNESLETFYEIEYIFGLNLMIKPIFINNNEIELTHKDWP